MSSGATRSRTADSTGDKYDHEIRLVDSTLPGGEESQRLDREESWRRIARIPTKTSVKEQLSRRKYAKWGQDRFDADDDGKASGAGTPQRDLNMALTEAHPDNEQSQTVDFGRGAEEAGVAETDTETQPITRTRPNGKTKKNHHKTEYEVDILYENQRGSFFCGIPLYSHSSLLNFDPAAWVTRDFRNSPVNITNAQVPDPSWVWAWKSWYVDMSYDVDEEGWQYSFAFGNNFAWHGTHPWFHSFVRRRRWLRKRVKRAGATTGGSKESAGTMEAAHNLNNDYFTIHSRARDRSPGDVSNPEAALARPASYTSFRRTIEEEDTAARPEDINSIASLMRSIRLATVDREKVDAVKAFSSHGGDELAYLGQHMEEIMSNLVFQNSRRQILQYLNEAAEKAKQHRDEHDAEDRPEGPNEKKRIDSLLQAANAAEKQILGLEYWSDRKHVLQTEDELRREQDEPQRPATGGGVGEIRGISEKAEISSEVRVDRRLLDKGKQPERQDTEYEDAKEMSDNQEARDKRDEQEQKVPDRLGPDAVFIPEQPEEGKVKDEKGQSTTK